MVVDALAPCSTRASAAMVLPLCDNKLLVFHQKKILKTTCMVSLRRNGVKSKYSKTSNISHTFVGNKLVDHSALLQLHLHSRLNTWLQWIEQRRLQDETRNIEVFRFGGAYIRGLMVYVYVHTHKKSVRFVGPMMIQQMPGWPAYLSVWSYHEARSTAKHGVFYMIKPLFIHTRNLVCNLMPLWCKTVVLKAWGCHDANFAVTDGSTGTSDKVGIMTTMFSGFQLTSQAY